jgi:hypothetical protein
MIDTIWGWIRSILEWIWKLFRETGDETNNDPQRHCGPVGVPPLNPVAPCPYCLQKIPSGLSSSQHCKHCDHEISAIYVRDAHTLPACSIEVFGWPGHGKTVYLYALTWVLDRIALSWKHFTYTCTPGTEVSRRRLKDVREAQRTGTMPATTPLGADEVYLLLLKGLARWNHRSLMIRDCSGEAFEGFRFDAHSLKYFKDAPFTMMFLSLPDLEEDFAASMDMLLVSYLETLLDQQIPETKKHLIVVLSKGDEIRDLPAKLRSYLLDDPVAALIGPIGSSMGEVERKFDERALNAYLEGMEMASTAIQEWLLESGWGTQFIQHIRRSGLTVRYCLVSSTGAPMAKDQSLEIVWAPKRVLDPLFWAFKMSESRF